MIDLFYPDGHNEFMRFLSFTLLLMAFFSGCASYHPKAPSKAPVREAKVPLKIPAPKLEKKNQGTVSYWELLSRKKVSLQFKNIDNGTYLTLIIEKGISDRPVAPGHWELTGFESNGVSFLSMNTTKKFVFRMSEKNDVYAGTIIIGCPQIPAVHNKHLMKMKFFNRYPFSSSTGLCEMIVGNDFNGVRTKVKKLKKSKKLNLILGF